MYKGGNSNFEENLIRLLLLLRRFPISAGATVVLKVHIYKITLCTIEGQSVKMKVDFIQFILFNMRFS